MPNYQPLSDRAIREVSQLRSEFELFRHKIEYNQHSAMAQAVPPNWSGFAPAVMLDDVTDPLSTGKAKIWRRWGQGSGGGLTYQEDNYEVEVFNITPDVLLKDEDLMLWRDVWGDWYPMRQFDRTSIFLTGSNGIPAATSKLSPGTALCTRMRFVEQTGFIGPYQGQSIVSVWNMAGGEDIEGNAIIQCKEIDYAWFVDVVPCEVPG